MSAQMAELSQAMVDDEFARIMAAEQGSAAAETALGPETVDANLAELVGTIGDAVPAETKETIATEPKAKRAGGGELSASFWNT